MYIFLKVAHVVMIYGVGKVFHTKLTDTIPILFSLCIWKEEVHPGKDRELGEVVFNNHTIFAR